MDPIERINPLVHQRDLMYPEHLGRYMFASQLVNGLDVIDCSCGNGYGSHYLALHGARTVLGIDIDQSAVDFSEATYSNPNLRYRLGDGTDLSDIPDNKIGAYVCFETIEHVLKVDEFLKEARRVLKPGGIFVVSCPNDNVFHPNNPFHVDVYTVDKFVGLIRNTFNNIQLFVQNNTTGTCIMLPDIVEGANVHAESTTLVAFPITKRTGSDSDTWIAVCSDGPIPTNISSTATFFTTYSDYVKEVQDTISSLYEENTRLANAWNEHVDTISSQTGELKRLSDMLNQRAEELTANERVLAEMTTESAKLANAWNKHTEVLRQQEEIIAALREENQRLAAAWDKHTEVLRQQEETITAFRDENQRLATAWEIHVNYIHGLEERITGLEKMLSKEGEI